MAKIIYARTLNPENYTGSPYVEEIFDDTNIVVDGGSRFNGYNDYIIREAKQLLEDSYNMDSVVEHCYDGDYKKWLEESLPEVNLKDDQVLENLLQALKDGNEEDVIFYYIEVVNGRYYKCRYIKGCCQGEVAKLYAPDYLNEKAIEYIEATVWGTGTEVEVHEGEENPTKPEDIEGWTFYTTSYNSKDIIRDIREEAGVGEDVEVKLYLYTRTKVIKIDQYKEAE